MFNGFILLQNEKEADETGNETGTRLQFNKLD